MIVIVYDMCFLLYPMISYIKKLSSFWQDIYRVHTMSGNDCIHLNFPAAKKENIIEWLYAMVKTSRNRLENMPRRLTKLIGRQFSKVLDKKNTG
jgi:hypothetical protein